MTPPEFDPKTIFEVPITTAGIRKVATLKYPSDAEWRELARGRKIVTEEQADGAFTKSITGEAAEKLFDRIHTGTEHFTQGEKEEFIAVLETCVIRDPDDFHNKNKEGAISGNQFRCTVTAPVMHEGKFRPTATSMTLKLPTVDHVREHTLFTFHRKNEMSIAKMNIDSAAKLFDALVSEVVGYKGDVPIIIRAKVAMALTKVYGEFVDPGEETPLGL